jgi:hypothetical protein
MSLLSLKPGSSTDYPHPLTTPEDPKKLFNRCSGSLSSAGLLGGVGAGSQVGQAASGLGLQVTSFPCCVFKITVRSSSRCPYPSSDIASPSFGSLELEIDLGVKVECGTWLSL